MSLTCQVQVILNNISKEKAETVKKALEPDNVDFPEGLSLYVENIDNKLVFNFESKKNMKQLTSTVDEVMEHIQVALKVIEYQVALKVIE
jgi:tRNA threonylcarbamoyladenosine modification (KEOPS) complex  Pcc1 subunit